MWQQMLPWRVGVKGFIINTLLMTSPRLLFLALSSFFLVVWFRFDHFLHSSWILNAAALLLAVALFFPLSKEVRDRSRYVIAGLWFLIVSLLVIDFVHSV